MLDGISCLYSTQSLLLGKWKVSRLAENCYHCNILECGKTINHIPLVRFVSFFFISNSQVAKSSVLKLSIPQTGQSKRATAGHSGGLKIMHKSQTGSGH